MPNLGSMNKLINKLTDTPFEYGVNDCYIFTASLVKEWHGKDFSLEHAVYNTESDARAYIAVSHGLEKLTSQTLGESCYPTDCRDGDVVIAHIPEPTLGFVFDGHGLFKTKRGIKKYPLANCKHGWRIG